ncbi:MAG: hypothetical protein GY928_14605 [Colwellia sp.]|nr:hypothetical protein [Colwellia sp.]
MNFITAIKSLFSGDKGVINQLSDVADRFITTKQEKAEFKTEVSQIIHAQEMELIRANNEDVEGARELQKAALNSGDKFAQRFIYYFAGFWSALAGAFIIIILFKEIPEPNTRLIDTILGFLLGTIIASIIGFFFGSSKGSHDKNSMIQNK